LPEGVLADAVWRDHAESGDDDTPALVHCDCTYYGYPARTGKFADTLANLARQSKVSDTLPPAQSVASGWAKSRRF
jgi:hypothetical protein